MEDTLRVQYVSRREIALAVLILILMEDTLREWCLVMQKCMIMRLNPCFNGRYSQRGYEIDKENSTLS